jgi:hypothetical protein
MELHNFNAHLKAD